MIFYFRLDKFDLIYYDDSGTTSKITSNSDVVVTYSELGLARDFNTLNALARLRLSVDISGNDYAFVMGIDKVLCPSTATGYKVAIAKDDNYCPLCFNSDGYIGILFNNSFVKATSTSYPTGATIQSFPGGNLAQVGCIKDGSTTLYYIDGNYIGSIGTSIDLYNTLTTDLYIGNFPTRDGRLGTLDEVFIDSEIISQPDMIKMFASFERYVAYTDDLSVNMYYSGNGIPSDSLGGAITSAAIDPYSDLNAVIPEVLRMDNFQGKSIYRCIYLKNTTAVTLFEPKLTIQSDLSGTTPTIYPYPKNTTPPVINDRYDTTNILVNFIFKNPEEFILTDYLGPNETVAIWIKERVQNVYIPSSILTNIGTIGSSNLKLVYLESRRFEENQFVLVYYQVDDDNFIYEFAQISTIDVAEDILTITSQLSQEFPIGSIVSKLNRSLLSITYGA